MQSLIAAMRLSSWVLERRAEEAALRKWISRESGVRCKNSFAATLLDATLVEAEDADIVVLRAIKDRLLYGDAISLMMVNSMLRLPVADKTAIVATIMAAPLGYDPIVSDSELHWAVSGLEEYTCLHEQLHGEYWRETSRLLITAALRIWNETGAEDLIAVGHDKNGSWRSMRIASDAAAALIVERGESQLDAIIAIMKERRSVDAELIAAVLDSDSKPLSSGEL